MKRISKKLVALALALAFALTLAVPGNVSEAAVKSVTAKIDVSKRDTFKNAKAIGVGSTRVTFAVTKTITRPGVKFTAPKAGTYRITVSSVKAPTGVTTMSGINGLIDVRQADKSGYPATRNVSTAYGNKTSTLWICNQKFYNSWYANKTGSALTEALRKPGAYLKSRSFPIKLKKGESVYLGAYFSYTNAANHKMQHSASCIVKVEKVN